MPEHLKGHTGYEHDLAVDTSRIRNELGYKEKVSRDEAILRTVGLGAGKSADRD